MKMGTERIREVLIDEMSMGEANPRSQALRLLIMSLVLCQIIGHTISQILCHTTTLSHAVGLGTIMGAGLLVFLFVAGRALSKTSSEQQGAQPAIVEFLTDLSQAFTLLTNQGENQNSSSLSPAAELILVLLNNGKTPRSKLESHLTKRGYAKDELRSALEMLEKGRFVSVKANGVNLVASKRRLFG